MMNLLFDIEEDTPSDIEGLTYIPDFISHDEERKLIETINAQPWLTDLKRRTQHYGYKYDYKARTIAHDSYLGQLPNWLEPITKELPFTADQAIVNEYMSGQGISAHIDCQPCFGDTIASLSLGSHAMMQFTHPQTGRKEEIYLKERSLIVLSGQARYEWTHAIPARKSDMMQGFKIPRERRISITFRSTIIEKTP